MTREVEDLLSTHSMPLLFYGSHVAAFAYYYTDYQVLLIPTAAC